MVGYKKSETSNGFNSRITTVCQFGKYFVMMGYDAFILPDGMYGGDMPLMPYVFTENSLKQFFGHTDRMKRYYQS